MRDIKIPLCIHCNNQMKLFKLVRTKSTQRKAFFNCTCEKGFAYINDYSRSIIEIHYMGIDEKQFKNEIYFELMFDTEWKPKNKRS